MTEHDEICCGNCPWVGREPVTEKMRCHVNPPTVLQGHSNIIAVWPHVSYHDWCGAHPALNVILKEADGTAT